MAKIKNVNALVVPPQVDYFHIQNRRYIGNKYKLADWIFSVINTNCSGSTFADIFAGTGVVSAIAATQYKQIIINDFLYSNNIVYHAFFGNEVYDWNKLLKYALTYNTLPLTELSDNYFSKNFGNRYFNLRSAQKIGYIRNHIEANKSYLSPREYSILLASLLYSTDRIANTVGHFDAYFHTSPTQDNFVFKLIQPLNPHNALIYREDANRLVEHISADIIYIDPPYNSRQYSRFYHVLETLSKWDDPKLYGVAQKPNPENMSKYCLNQAKASFSELITLARAKYLVVSYNNTYSSKSSSSRNKITLEEIREILQTRGKTTSYERDYRHFNAGNTNFKNHKEYLFVTEVEL